MSMFAARERHAYSLAEKGIENIITILKNL